MELLKAMYTQVNISLQELKNIIFFWSSSLHFYIIFPSTDHFSTLFYTIYIFLGGDITIASVIFPAAASNGRVGNMC